MFTGFANIVNNLKALGRDISNIELVNKILLLLRKSWEPKVTAILETKYLTTLKLGQLFRSLITHKRITSTTEKKKKKVLALKVSTLNDEVDVEEDEEVAVLSRKFKPFLNGRKEG